MPKALGACQAGFYIWCSPNHLRTWAKHTGYGITLLQSMHSLARWMKTALGASCDMCCHTMLRGYHNSLCNLTRGLASIHAWV